MTWFTEQETSKTAPNTKSEASAGNRINPGPYIGIVKNVVDPLYSGRLQVYIPDLGGDETDPTSYKSMMYATPFYGRTNIQDGSSFAGSPHSYGMWFVPPDIDNKVLCIFANGDPAKGYWFACIPDWPALHMVPGISGPVDGSSPAPVVDHFDNKDNPSNLSSVRTLDRYIHEYQQKTWEDQGLLQDPDRGPGRSSAQRETPSGVFGISTPGRPILDEDPQLYPDNLGFTSGGVKQKTPGQLMGVMGRKGGHTLVMDDGDANGNNQMFRIRSAAGHMILMNDTKEFLYIINSKGTAWVEMDAKGSINVYAESQMNIFAKDSFSLESSGAIKIKGKTVDILAENGLSLQGADVNVLGSGSTKIAGKQNLHLHSKKNTYLTGESCIQIKADGHIDLKASCHTINTADATKATEAAEVKNKPTNMPQHEPRNKGAGSLTASPTPNAKNNAATNPNNPYGQGNNFGSGGAQPNYGPQTNNVQPVVYNSGPQGSLQGQGSVYGSYKPDNYNGGGIDWTVAGTIAGAIAGIAFSGGSSYNVTNDADPKLSVGEAQNNPGNLPYNNTDTFAVGYNNNLAVYAKPEGGIAALALAFDALNIGVSTRSIDLIQGFLNAKSNVDPKVIDMTRYMHQNLGIVADDYVALYDPNTRIGWVAYAIQYIQGRLIYSYDQVVTGCALSLGISVTDFLMGIQPLTKPWQNNNGYNPLSGFVNPAQNNNIVQRGSSPLQTIGSAIGGGLIGGLIGSFIQGNQRSNQGGIVAVTDANSARRYLEANPNTPNGTVFQYPDGSTFTLGGGSVTYVDNGGYNVTNVQQYGGPTNEAIGSDIRFDGIINNGTQGSGGCATLAQTYAPNLGHTSTWSAGDSITNGTAQPGDVYATFAPGGSYTGQSGTCHTVIFNNYTYDNNGNINGAYVTEQYVGQPPHTAFYSASRTDKYEVFQNFKRVQSDTAPSGANVTQTQQYNNVTGQRTQQSYAQDSNPIPQPRDNTPVVETSDSRDMKSTAVRSPMNPNDAFGDTIANPKDTATGRYYDPRTGEVVSTYSYSGGAPAGANPGDIATGGYGAPAPNTDFYPEDFYSRTAKNYDTIYDPRTNDVVQVEKPSQSAYYYYDDVHPASSSVYNPYEDSANTELKNVTQSSTYYERDYLDPGQNRNSDITTESNFDAASKAANLGSDNNLGIAAPDAADAPLAVNNYQTTYDVRTGEVVTVGSSGTAVQPPSVSNVNGVRPEYDPLTGKLINQPITGANKPPGTGGANGGQKTPQGSSQTGAGGKSC
jgi:hypothetical protein